MFDFQSCNMLTTTASLLWIRSCFAGYVGVQRVSARTVLCAYHVLPLFKSIILKYKPPLWQDWYSAILIWILFNVHDIFYHCSYTLYKEQKKKQREFNFCLQHYTWNTVRMLVDKSHQQFVTVLVGSSGSQHVYGCGGGRAWSAVVWYLRLDVWNVPIQTFAITSPRIVFWCLCIISLVIRWLAWKVWMYSVNDSSTFKLIMGKFDNDLCLFAILWFIALQ